MSGASAAFRLLFVDDDAELAELVATMLERTEPRFTVDIALDATEAMDRLDRTSYDAVVSDYDMPGRNGLELLEAIRDRGFEYPFILYTGKGNEEIASEALSMGVTDYRQKSVGTEHYELLTQTCLNAVKQHRAERRAANLDRIRRVVQDVNQALVRAETQEELDERVCAIVATAEPYRLAWVGDHDRAGRRVVPRASAGSERGYLDAIEITTDDSETGLGPTGLAVNTREIQILQDVQEATAYAPWRAAADERGYRSSAAVPIVYEDELLGVLNVYADRPHAFDAAERELLIELADDIAHASHTLELRDELQDTMARLERQNERLNEFTGLVSHDLRNPLGVAQGRLELAREACESEHLDAAVSALDRIEELVVDLLTLARVGRTSIDPERVDLGTMVRQCWEHVDTADAGLVVETDRPLWADRQQLKQCLENLLRNAVEHGGDGVTVTIGDLRDDDGFYLEDDGGGILEADRERVFEAGHSGSSSGTGFGLAIVKEVVETHGWDLTLTASADDGARFEFRHIHPEPEDGPDHERRPGHRSRRGGSASP